MNKNSIFTFPTDDTYCIFLLLLHSSTSKYCLCNLTILHIISKDFWDSATIVYYTSAICKMYDMTEETKQTMVTILDHIKSKVWIPGHVMTEYLRNREKVIRNPLTLREIYKNAAIFSTTALRTKGRQFIKKLENQGYFHPISLKTIVR